MPHGRDGRPFRSPDEVPAIADIRRRCQEKGADFDFIWTLAQLAVPSPAKLSRAHRACFDELKENLPRLIEWLGSYTEAGPIELPSGKFDSR